MRVIAGKFRSRQLRTAPSMDVRPSSDRLRETLFNVLAASYELQGSRWIDLFAGTGAVGIEALSRGAESVYFIERATGVARVIQANLKALGIGSEAEVLVKEAIAGLRELEKRGAVCDFLFLDPPYRQEGAYEGVLRVLANSPLLTNQSVVIAEHTKHFDPGDGMQKLVRYRRLDQGDASLSFYRLAAT